MSKTPTSWRRGLNVEASNEAALRIYERLGFRRAFQYEEIELL